MVFRIIWLQYGIYPFSPQCSLSWEDLSLPFFAGFKLASALAPWGVICNNSSSPTLWRKDRSLHEKTLVIRSQSCQISKIEHFSSSRYSKLINLIQFLKFTLCFSNFQSKWNGQRLRKNSHKNQRSCIDTLLYERAKEN